MFKYHQNRQISESTLFILPRKVARSHYSCLTPHKMQENKRDSPRAEPSVSDKITNRSENHTTLFLGELHFFSHPLHVNKTLKHTMSHKIAIIHSSNSTARQSTVAPQHWQSVQSKSFISKQKVVLFASVILDRHT